MHTKLHWIQSLKNKPSSEDTGQLLQKKKKDRNPKNYTSQSTQIELG